MNLAVSKFFGTTSINCEVNALFSATDRCFPRARLQPPRETHSAGSSDTCCSRRSQRSFAPNKHRNSESELYTTVAKRHVSEGNTRRLLRESEDDETPQRAFCASEEAHREPAESVVYFQSGMLLHSLYQLREVRASKLTERKFLIFSSKIVCFWLNKGVCPSEI